MTLVLVAPQEFKGTLTAAEAAHAMAAGARDALPVAIVIEAPMSDGGAGLVDALLAACGGTKMSARVHDPLMRPIDATWARLEGGTGVVEMAAASGLVLLDEQQRNPRITTTYGTGELIRAALDAGCREIIVGVGGSATVDAGGGALQALGARLLDPTGCELAPGGAALSRLKQIDRTALDPRLARARLRIACDVTNVLCGPQGAAAVFGPQKGAGPHDTRALDDALTRFAEVARRDCGINVATVPGAGAAGGLAAGLLLAGGVIERGFALVAEITRLEEQVMRADIVLTGEGRLDAQTAYGKTAAGVAAIARAHGRPVGAVAGSVTPDADLEPFDAAIAAAPEGMPAAEAMRQAPELVRDAAARAVRMLVDGTGSA